VSSLSFFSSFSSFSFVENPMSANPYESPGTPGTPQPRARNWMRRLLELFVIVGILFLFFVCLTPFGRFPRFGAREAARRMACSNNLRNIAIALQNYEAVYGYLPPAYTVDEAGKPLHSWRTLILPYIEEKALYDQIDLSKPWDDPANRKAYETKLKQYVCPSSDIDNGQTTYLAVVTANGCFKPSEPRRLADITDDKDLTLMVLEAPEEHAVHWMAPNDLDDELLSKLGSLDKSPHPGRTQAVCVTGLVRALVSGVSPATLQALISIAGNDNDIARKDD
jgi:hypothetical protein